MGQVGHSKVILGHSGVILGHLLESCSCAHLMLCLPNVLNFSKLPIFLLIRDSFRFTSKKLESVSCILLISVKVLEVLFQKCKNAFLLMLSNKRETSPPI